MTLAGSRPATARPAATDGAPPGRKIHYGLILAACCLGQFMVVFDASIVNVALPSISDALRFEPNRLQWVSTAYTIAASGFLLLAGRLADLYGQRRLFLSGVSLFTLASGVGALASGATMLVAARGFQGLGAAFMAPATLTVLGTTFREPAARAKAFGLWSAVSGTAGALGVLIGGVITQWLSWRWILLVNVPAGLVLLLLVLLAVPERRQAAQRRPLDVRGAVSVTLGLMALVFALAESHSYGWTSPRVLTAALAAAGLLAAFVRIQLRSPDPLVPLSVFRNRGVLVANVVAFFAIAALFSTFYFFTLILQQVLGYSPLQTGVAYLPMSAGIAIVGWRVSPLVPRIGARPLLVGGLSVAATGLVWLSTVEEGATFLGSVLGPTLLIGAGMGAVLNATTNAATAGLPREQAGIVSGLLNTTRQLGNSVGLVILVLLAAARTDAYAGRGTTALAAGYDLAVLGAAGFALVALLASFWVRRVEP